MAQYAIKGYTVRATDYVLKPVSYFSFSQRLDKVIGRINRNVKKYMAVNIKGGTVKLYLPDIYYIESLGHRLIFHTLTGEYVTFGAMKEVEERLKGLNFFRCSKGYLLNLEHVEKRAGGLRTDEGSPADHQQNQEKRVYGGTDQLSGRGFIMNHIVLTEIPRLYTGIAEWAACTIYVLNLKRKLKGPSLAAVMCAACLLQCGIQLAAGTFPKSLWIPGMLLAIGLMQAYFMITCEVTAGSAGYYCVRSFILAEFTASLEWQLYYNAVLSTQISEMWLNILVFIIVFGAVFGGAYFLERKHIRKETITLKELLFVTATGATVFFVSNLSFVYSNSPFSSQITKEIFNIRTLVDLSGLVILLHITY